MTGHLHVDIGARARKANTDTLALIRLREKADAVIHQVSGKNPQVGDFLRKEFSQLNPKTEEQITRFLSFANATREWSSQSTFHPSLIYSREAVERQLNEFAKLEVALRSFSPEQRAQIWATALEQGIKNPKTKQRATIATLLPKKGTVHWFHTTPQVRQIMWEEINRLRREKELKK